MIRGERVILRPVERDDLPFLRSMRNDERLRRWIFSFMPLSMSEQERWYEGIIKDERNKVFIVEVEGESTGYVQLKEIDYKNQSVEVGIHITPDRQGRGIGQDALTTLLRFVFSEMNMNRAYVNTYEHNKRAISLFEKLGFKKEGILREAIYSSGRFQNIQVMSLLRREFLKV